MNDEQLALRLRMLPALAFAPPFEVQELFLQIIEQLDIPASLELALYFETTYIGRTVSGGTQLAPLFPLRCGTTITLYLRGYLVQPTCRSMAQSL